MDPILTNVRDPSWWFTVVAVGLVVGVLGNLASNALSARVPLWWGRYSEAQRKRSWERAERLTRRARTVMADPMQMHASMAVLVFSSAWGVFTLFMVAAGAFALVAVGILAGNKPLSPESLAGVGLIIGLTLGFAVLAIYFFGISLRHFSLAARMADLAAADRRKAKEAAKEAQAPITGDLSSDEAQAPSAQSSTPG